MILIEDSITDDLYQKCVKELNEKLSENCWKSSSLNWGSDVKQGVDGSCIITPVSDTIIYLFCLLYTSPSPRDLSTSRMPSSA